MTRLPQQPPLATLALLLATISACGSSSSTDASDALPLRAVVGASGLFGLIVNDVGQDAVIEQHTFDTRDVSAEAATDFASSDLVFDQQPLEETQVYSFRHTGSLEPGGERACLSYHIELVVYVPGRYEIVGGMEGTSNGSPEDDVRLSYDVELAESGGQSVLFYESDYATDQSSVSFSVNGSNEGDFEPAPHTGSRTGVLQPRPGEDRTAFTFSGGSCAVFEGRTDLAARVETTLAIRVTALDAGS